MMTMKDAWPLSAGNVVEDLQRWKGLYTLDLQGKRYAPRTLVIYSGVIDELIEYSRQFQDEIVINDVGTFFITRFLEEKTAHAKNGLSDTTRAHYIKVFKVFFKFIDENNIESFGILYNLRNLKIRKQNGLQKKKPAYTEDQVDRIILTIENIRKKTESHQTHAFTSTRNFLITKFILFSGIRADEMAKVRYEDLEPFTEHKSRTPMYRVEVLGKGGGREYVYIKREHIDDELDIMRERFSAKGLIAVSLNGKPLGPVQINHNVSRITKAAGMAIQGVHIFRHTYARSLLRQGEDIEIVRQLLRHKRISTTVDFYIATDEEAKSAAAARVGRRGIIDNGSRETNF
jgi:integrase/recombinase XerD